jgi:very-short-patch-repair endonuclease
MPETDVDKPFGTTRPFLRSDARRMGLPAREFRGSRFRRLFKGVRIDGSTPVTPLVLGEGALLLHPAGAFVSHRTAAAIHGVAAPTSIPEVDVSVTDKAHRRFTSGIRPHLARDDNGVTTIRGVRVSSACRTFAELARVLSPVDLVVVGDRFVKLGRCTTKELATYCESWNGYFRRKAIYCASLVRVGVDSPMETRLRMLIVLAGLPEPTVNFKLRRANGTVWRRFDLSYPTVRLVIEYDGRQHAEDSDQWHIDIERREELDDEQWRLLIVTRKGIYDSPLDTLVRVRNKLIALGHPQVPRHFSDGWQQHFM